MEFEVYCDESRQENIKQGRDDSYVLIGGLWIEAAERPTYKRKIHQLRESYDVWGEFKWNRVSPSRQEFYVSLIRLFFSEAMRFRCIVLPAGQLDAIRFHRGDEELMFYKFYYQLLHHWVLDFNTYRIFVDMKTNRPHHRLRVLEQVLQNSNLTSDVLAVQALPSQEVDLLQMVDVLIGAVGYHFHRHDTSPAKLAVIAEIEGCLGHRIRATSRAESKFNIFRFRPGGGW